jgi:hypothetical protein
MAHNKRGESKSMLSLPFSPLGVGGSWHFQGGEREGGFAMNVVHIQN